MLSFAILGIMIWEVKLGALGRMFLPLYGVISILCIFWNCSMVEDPYGQSESAYASLLYLQAPNTAVCQYRYSVRQ